MTVLHGSEVNLKQVGSGSVEQQPAPFENINHSGMETDYR